MTSGQGLHELKRLPRFVPGERIVMTRDALRQRLGPRSGRVLRVDGRYVVVKLDGRKTPGHFHAGFWRHARATDQHNSAVER